MQKTLTRIAIACFVVGLALTGFFVWRMVVNLPHTPQSIQAGERVRLDKPGLTIYSSVPVLRAPCTVTDAHAAEVPVYQPKGSETITLNGDTWYVVAKSTHKVPAGEYAVTCADTETSATYAVGPHSSVVQFVLSIFGAIGSFLLFTILGVVLLAIGVSRGRRNRNQPMPPTGPQYPPTQPPYQPNQAFPAPPPYNPGPNPDRPQDR